METLFGSMAESLVLEITEKIKEMADLPFTEQVSAHNTIKKALHECGPFRDEPVDCVLWVPIDTVESNDYNPNAVAPPEMRLLEHSIKMDGYTQPIVTSSEDGRYIVVDGAHRMRVGKESPFVGKRIKGYLPITQVRQSQTDVKNRMAATIRHNRARGVHGVEPMVDIVADLIRQGWEDDEVAREIGMDADEVLRYKQHAGLPDLFKDSQYSKAWE